MHASCLSTGCHLVTRDECLLTDGPCAADEADTASLDEVALLACCHIHAYLAVFEHRPYQEQCLYGTARSWSHTQLGGQEGGGAQSEHYTCQVLLDPKLSFVNAGGRVGGGLMLKP